VDIIILTYLRACVLRFKGCCGGLCVAVFAGVVVLGAVAVSTLYSLSFFLSVSCNISFVASIEL